MKKYITAILLSGLTLSSFGSGYKIPEQSERSLATAAAYFSSANFADVSYYNPANMSWLKDKKFLEIGTRYIHLNKINFNGQAYDPVSKTFVISNAKSKSEDFLVPYFHFVSSPFIENARLGLSFVTPAGLSKRWTAKGQKATAEEFTLKVYEFDSSVSYKITDKFSIAGTARLIYATGKVKYQAPPVYQVNMDGNSSIKTGWAVSASLKPTENWNISTIYRSKVDLDINGSIKGYLNVPTLGISRNPISPSGGDVKIPLPAEWKLGTSYKIKNTTLEFTFERTFWSKYKTLDFNFADPYAEAILGQPKAKNWKDSNAYRFGITHEFNKKLTVLGGIAYDKTPIPEKTLGFELPDSDSWIFSVGSIYSPNKRVEIGLAYLYVTKKDRNVNNDNIKGKFSDLSAHLFNVEVGYKF
ncbi:OmpP1/FadL family transporter [Hydrogenothermus marinus]|uniref:Long-chain fatty acid transport protein n=1 Tax=Hydrogenothermus marinus TaxID=133270 RepID=A0A3M0BR21_9AQUI|nr:OmpP1/FadL family transporter [Hydrogenothermus marinus]RMA97278.1 long-chain fatty acid transport protein [Hydrogenothermus marinus]